MLSGFEMSCDESDSSLTSVYSKMSPPLSALEVISNTTGASNKWHFVLSFLCFVPLRLLKSICRFQFNIAKKNIDGIYLARLLGMHTEFFFCHLTRLTSNTKNDYVKQYLYRNTNYKE